MATPFTATRTVTRSSVGTPTVKKTTKDASYITQSVSDAVKKAKAAQQAAKNSGFTTSSGNISHNAAAPSTAADTFVTKSSALDTEPTWLKYAPVIEDNDTSGVSASSYYNKYLKEQQKAIQKKIDASVQANNAYIPEINQASDQSLQNAYILREQNRVNAPQALSAMGYTGGATETSMMGINTGYENTRNQVEQNRAKSLAEIQQNEAQIRATGDAALSDAAATYYQNLIAKQEATEASQKTDFVNSIGAYGDDYMAQYNKVTGDNDPTNDYQAAYLLDARNDKISGQAETKKKDEQTATENYIKMQRLLYDINKPYFKPGSNGAGGLSESEIISMYTNGLISEADARRMLGLE